MSAFEFWHDFASPYSYIAAMRLDRLARDGGLRAEWRPFLLGPIFRKRRADGQPFQDVGPAERRYRTRDLERLCARHAIPWRLPDRYPPASLLAARLAEHGRVAGWSQAFSVAVYGLAFAGNTRIDDPAVLAPVLAGLGADAGAALAACAEPPAKAALASAVAEAEGRGIFGAPSFVVDGELFWGSDRLDHALDWAQGNRPV